MTAGRKQTTKKYRTLENDFFFFVTEQGVISRVGILTGLWEVQRGGTPPLLPRIPVHPACRFHP